jgi:hypothetical protein
VGGIIFCVVIGKVIPIQTGIAVWNRLIAATIEVIKANDGSGSRERRSDSNY